MTRMMQIIIIILLLLVIWLCFTPPLPPSKIKTPMRDPWTNGNPSVTTPSQWGRFDQEKGGEGAFQYDQRLRKAKGYEVLH